MLQKIYHKVIKPKRAAVGIEQQKQQNDEQRPKTPPSTTVLQQQPLLPPPAPTPPPPPPLELPQPQCFLENISSIEDESPIFKSPTTKIEYPSRTRILRNLSSGANTPICATTSPLINNQPQSDERQQPYCCICNNNNRTLTTGCNSRRQSWGSYSYLNRTLQQQQQQHQQQLLYPYNRNLKRLTQQTSSTLGLPPQSPSPTPIKTTITESKIYYSYNQSINSLSLFSLSSNSNKFI